MFCHNRKTIRKKTIGVKRLQSKNNRPTAKEHRIKKDLLPYFKRFTHDLPKGQLFPYCLAAQRIHAKITANQHIDIHRHETQRLDKPCRISRGCHVRPCRIAEQPALTEIMKAHDHQHGKDSKQLIV